MKKRYDFNQVVYFRVRKGEKWFKARYASPEYIGGQVTRHCVYMKDSNGYYSVKPENIKA